MIKFRRAVPTGLVGLMLACSLPGAASAEDVAPGWAADLPAATTQVVRTIRSDEWCAEIHCTRTEAWSREGGEWQVAERADGEPAVFRSTIGPEGFGKQREGDNRTPSGTFSIVVTVSTSSEAPGAMPWRRRLPSSVVSEAPGANYNTWLEVPGATTGNRPAFRFGFLVDYNHPRLVPGQGPAPVPDAGSGIFFHTSRPGHLWDPTLGCVALGNPADMEWVVRWLNPSATPRVVLDR